MNELLFTLESDIQNMKEYNSIITFTENVMILYESGDIKSSIIIIVDKIKDLCSKIVSKIKDLKAKVLSKSEIPDKYKDKTVKIPDYRKIGKLNNQYQQEINNCKTENDLNRVSEKYEKRIKTLKKAAVITIPITFLFGRFLSEVAHENEKIENEIKSVVDQIANKYDDFVKNTERKGYRLNNKTDTKTLRDAVNKNTASLTNYLPVDKKKISIFRLKKNLEILNNANAVLADVTKRIHAYSKIFK